MYQVKIIKNEEKKVVALALHTTFAANKQAKDIPPFFHYNMENGIFDNVPNRSNDNQICVFVMQPGNPDFDYYMGVEVSNFDNVPKGMETLIVPASEFASASFIKRGNPDALSAFKYLTESWLPQNGFARSMNVPMYIYYDERFIPSFKAHGYDGTQIAEMNIPVKTQKP